MRFTVPGLVNHHDPVNTCHRAGGEPGVCRGSSPGRRVCSGYWAAAVTSPAAGGRPQARARRPVDRTAKEM